MIKDFAIWDCGAKSSFARARGIYICKQFYQVLNECMINWVTSFVGGGFSKCANWGSNKVLSSTSFFTEIHRSSNMRGFKRGVDSSTIFVVG